MGYRILVLTSTFPRWRRDSVPDFVFKLCQGVSRKGFDVWVLAPHYPGSRERERRESMEVRRFHYFWPEYLEILCYDQSMLVAVKSSLKNKLIAGFFLLSEILSAIRLCREIRPHIINSHWVVPQGFVGCLLHFLFDIPHVMTIHAAGLYVLSSNCFGRRLLELILRGSNKIFIVSEYGKRVLRRAVSDTSWKSLADRIIVVPMGVDTKVNVTIKKDLKTKMLYDTKTSKLILFIGRISRKKGLQFLLQAMTILKDCCLLVVGRGELEKDMQLMAKNLGISNRVKFVGFVTEETKKQLLAISDVLVIPSVVTPEGDAEGVPVVLLEGLTMGKPIVATRSGGIPEILIHGKTGLLVRPGDPEAIAQAVNMLLQTPSLREELSRQGRLLSEKFDWEKVAKRYVEIYQEVLTCSD